MAHRIDAMFSARRAAKRPALIAYVTGGFPSMAALDRVVTDLEAAGVDLVEIGVPFSDPIADGPTIQYSSQKALEGGATLDKILAWVTRFRRRSQLPLVLMSYLNPVSHKGEKAFARAAARAGVDGLIVPDLIPEEAGPFRAALLKEGIYLIHLVAPTTPPARRQQIAALSRGFVYVVSVTGVTGVRRGVSATLPGLLRGLRRTSPVPVAVGFGVSTPEDARRLGRLADGVIVGSAFIQKLKNNDSVKPLARALRAALGEEKPHAR